MTSVPLSAYQETLGMIYFARMLSKIRLHAEGKLREDFTGNLGSGFDGLCTGFLRIDYDRLVQRTLEGGTDEHVLEWCFENGRRPNGDDILIWNMFMTKTGWRDARSESLARWKRESGLENKTEIQTMAEYFEYDEGRKM